MDNRAEARALNGPIITIDDEVRIERIAAALDVAFSRGSAWRPIADAPRDGTSILVWGPHGHEHLVVDWDDGRDANYCWATLDGPYYPNGAFTHWQPLPDPPALAAIPAPPA